MQEYEKDNNYKIKEQDLSNLNNPKLQKK